MQYRKLGSSDLSVSEIALGSWLTYSGGIDKSTSMACVHRALDLGINFIDTANIYGRGVAESVLGEALAGVPRDSYVLATKLFFPMTDSDRGLSRAQIHKQIDASLARLKTDYVDLYQCHRFDPETPLEETMQALTRSGCRWQGAICWLFGMASGWNPRGSGHAWRCSLRVEPTAIFAAVARAGTGNHPFVPSQRHFANRMVAACARRLDREVQGWRKARIRNPCGKLGDGRISQASMVRETGAGCDPEPEAARQFSGTDPKPIRARLGIAREERRFRDHRSHTA